MTKWYCFAWNDYIPRLTVSGPVVLRVCYVNSVFYLALFARLVRTESIMKQVVQNKLDKKDDFNLREW